MVFDIDGPAVVRLRILLLLNMLIAVFVSGGMRRSSQFRLNLGRPFAEIVEEEIDVVVGGGFDVEDVEEDAVAEADGAMEEDAVVGFVAFCLGDAVIVVFNETEQLAGGGGLRLAVDGDGAVGDGLAVPCVLHGGGVGEAARIGGLKLAGHVDVEGELVLMAVAAAVGAVVEMDVGIFGNSSAPKKNGRSPLRLLKAAMEAYSGLPMRL